MVLLIHISIIVPVETVVRSHHVVILMMLMTVHHAEVLIHLVCVVNRRLGHDLAVARVGISPNAARRRRRNPIGSIVRAVRILVTISELAEHRIQVLPILELFVVLQLRALLQGVVDAVGVLRRI